MNTTSIHIEITDTQLKALRCATKRNRRILLVVDADAVAISDWHSEAWLKARATACSQWGNQS